MRVVRSVDSGRGPRTPTQVLLGELPSPSVGAGPGRSRRPRTDGHGRPIVATYPGTISEWVVQLDRLARDVLEGRLDGEALSGSLDTVYAAIAYRGRDDRHNEPW